MNNADKGAVRRRMQRISNQRPQVRHIPLCLRSRFEALYSGLDLGDLGIRSLVVATCKLEHVHSLDNTSDVHPCSLVSRLCLEACTGEENVLEDLPSRYLRAHDPVKPGVNFYIQATHGNSKMPR